jgi:large subunit ribosomal protein L6
VVKEREFSMSRIGKKPVPVPKGVTVKYDKNIVTISGPKGNLSQEIENDVTITIENSQVVVVRKDDSKRTRSLHGLYRNLVQNMMTGVASGFTRVLQIVGVGYKAEVKGKKLVINIGFANPVEYDIPDGVAIRVDANTKIIASSNDKHKLGQACAIIRAIRPPEPYKGKGIRYENEAVRKKVGKTGVK